MDKLPIKIDDLIQRVLLEETRIEYKKTFDDHTELPIIATISAYANDFMNLNGGYIVIGIDAPKGIPILPPSGLLNEHVEKIQQKIRVLCKTKIKPEYQPVIVTEKYLEKQLIVIWAHAGDNRPYESPDVRNKDTYTYHIRIGAETVVATSVQKRQLLEQTTKIPFDDRQNTKADIYVISPTLVKRFLNEVNSDLLNIDPPFSDEQLYNSLQLVRDVGGVSFPRNVSILFFNETPEKHFPCAKFEVAHFRDDSSGDLFEEHVFSGPLDKTVTEVIKHLDNLTNVQIRKLPNMAQVERTVAFPYQALEEAVVNAAYHRSYEGVLEPNKVYLYPNRIEIISYPGPVNGIEASHLCNSEKLPPVPARNRRIGEFLKELRLAEMRGTGIPKIKRTMRENESPEPTFDFDPDRSYFRVTLPAHPKYNAVHVLRESSYLWSVGKKNTAIEMLESIYKGQLGTGILASKLIEWHFDNGDASKAASIFQLFHNSRDKSEAEMPYLTYFKVLISNGFLYEAKKVIQMLPEDYGLNNPAEVAVAYKRVKLYDRAHIVFSSIYYQIENKPVYLHDYAQTKIEIANNLVSGRKPIEWDTVNRLRTQAIELLRRAISLIDKPGNEIELAWCWFDMARTMQHARKRPGKPYSYSEIEDAYDNAINILPHEKRFFQTKKYWQSHVKRKENNI